MKPIQLDGVTYTKENLPVLQKRLIELRDEHLNQNNFGGSIILTHTIGVLAYVIEELEE